MTNKFLILLIFTFLSIKFDFAKNYLAHPTLVLKTFHVFRIKNAKKSKFVQSIPSPHKTIEIATINLSISDKKLIKP